MLISTKNEIDRDSDDDGMEVISPTFRQQDHCSSNGVKSATKKVRIEGQVWKACSKSDREEGSKFDVFHPSCNR
jgi:hypothetical protein